MAAVAAHGRPRERDWAGALATAAGKVTGRILRVLPTVPGLAGAAAVSVCMGELVSHIWGHGLAPWVGGMVGGVFLLLLDRRIPRPGVKRSG